MLNASVCEFRDLLLTALAVLGVVLNTSVSDLCHCVTPKVVGFLIRSFSRLRPRRDERTRSATYLRPRRVERCGYDNIPILYSQVVWYNVIPFLHIFNFIRTHYPFNDTKSMFIMLD